MISIHKALAGLDVLLLIVQYLHFYFNPQGPRGPRRIQPTSGNGCCPISIHKALAGLDDGNTIKMAYAEISIHKALAGLDVMKASD